MKWRALVIPRRIIEGDTQHRRRMGVYVLWTVVLCSWLIVGPSSEFYYILVKLCKVVKHFREIFFFLQLLLHVSMFRGL